MKKSPHQLRVEEFMGKFGQEVPDKPTVPDETTRLLRAKLIFEEALETVWALGFEVVEGLYSVKQEKWIGHPITQTNVRFEVRKGEIHLADIADGCGDISVVSTGTLSACGIQDEPVLEEIDKNNLAKFGEGGFKSTDGKWIKPPNHKAPELNRVLKSQGGP